MQKQAKTSLLRDARMLPLLLMGGAAAVLAWPALGGEASMRILGQLQLTLQLICLFLLGILLRRTRGKRESAFLLLAGLVAVGGVWLILRPSVLTARGYMRAVSLAGLCGGITVLAAMIISPRPFMEKPERLFLLLVVAFGLSYVFGILPTSAPDERHHLRITLTAASRLLYGDTLVDPTYLVTEGFTGHQNTTQAAATVAQGLLTEVPAGVLEPMGAEAKDISFILPYIPQVLGTMLGMALGVNRIMLYVLGDLFNLAFYAAFTCLAIRIIPKWKVTLALVAALPMALHQAGSLSSDALINAMGYLLVALIVRAAVKRERIGWKNAAPMLIATIMLAGAKPVYACMLLALLILPKECYRSTRHKWLFLVGMCAVTGIAVLLLQGIHIAETAAGGNVNAEFHYTVPYALAHPIEVIRIFVMSHAPNVLYAMLETTIGRVLSGQSLELYHGDAWCMVILLMASVFYAKPDEPMLRRRDRLTLAVSAGLVYAAVLVTMLFAWTNVGEMVIQGVQGRYFLPVLPMALMALQSRNVVIRKDPSRWIVCGFALLSMMMILEITRNTLKI